MLRPEENQARTNDSTAGKTLTGAICRPLLGPRPSALAISAVSALARQSKVP
jgi:hypothetical protein